MIFKFGDQNDSPFGGAVGAGLVLVTMPCLAVFVGVKWLSTYPVVGLPILAIFGIMILFGSVALTSTLFARLGLSDKSEALALPEGSIRAAIALSLIVLFAIIAIMLHQSSGEPYVLKDLSESEKAAVVNEPANLVLAVVKKCASESTAVAACPPESSSFEIHLQRRQSQEASDLAKQLLTLIGTLMTAVTSFYFASRATETAHKTEGTESPTAPQTATEDAENEEADGCDIPIESATKDDELPPSTGGVS